MYYASYNKIRLRVITVKSVFFIPPAGVNLNVSNERILPGLAPQCMIDSAVTWTAKHFESRGLPFEKVTESSLAADALVFTPNMHSFVIQMKTTIFTVKVSTTPAQGSESNLLRN